MTVALQPAAQPASRSDPSGTRISYIAPLDGVRAIAVLSVMAYHGGVGFMSGGFLGVDTFFVLSGFLITTLLTGEWALTQRIRLGRFWGRRARRLLPALLLMLLFVAAYAAFAVPAGTYPGLRSDAFFTLFYSANWHFIASSANYFSASGPVSPLTHTWSLAVEEQFYLIWPLVVIGVMVLAGKRTVKGLRLLFVVSVVGAMTSAIAMAILWTGGNDTRLYYGTDTHAQCMLIGAALAILLALAAHARRRRNEVPPSGGQRPKWGGDPAWIASSRRSRALLTVVGGLGAVVTVVMWVSVNGGQWWLYHGGFLVAALASAAIILSAACAQGAPVGRLLSLRPLRYVGRISYGMYLWHFPLFVWLDHQRTGLSNWSLFGFRVIVTILVASASFFAVEMPVREGTFLRGRRGLVAVPAGIAVVLLAVVLATNGSRPGSGLASAAAHTVRHADSPKAATGHLATTLLVGDSMAETLGNGFEGPVGRYFGLDIINEGVPNCSLAIGAFAVQNFSPNLGAPSCDPLSGSPLWPAQWANLVAQYHPAVSVILTRLDIVNRLYDGQWTHIGVSSYDRYLLGQMRLAVHVLTAEGGRVVFLTTPYYSTGEQPDGLPWPEDDPARVDEYNAMIRQVASENPGEVSVLDLNKIADPDGHFQATIDGVAVRYVDGIHWTFAGDCWLAPRVLPLVATVARVGSVPSLAKASVLTSHAVEEFPSSICPQSP